MKRIIFVTVLAFGLSAFGSAQAQDTTGRSQNKSGTMKKGKTQRKMKNNRRGGMDSTGTYGTMDNRRRDSL